MSCWGFFSLIIFILPPQKLYKINRLLINLCPYRSRYIWPPLLVIGGEYEEGGVGEDGDLPILLKLSRFCCRLKVRICFAHPSSEDKCKWILFLMKGQRRKERRFNVKWLLIFFLLPFLQFHLVCCPVQDCKCKCLEKMQFFFLRKSWDCHAHLPLSLLFQLLRLSLSFCILSLKFSWSLKLINVTGRPQNSNLFDV